MLPIDISLSASPLLFHITHVTNAVKMIKDNKIILTSSEGTEAEKNHEIDPYYLSTTRHNLGKYTTVNSYSGKVILTLDGTKLASNHKIRAIDYWGEDYRKFAKGDYEAEDRVYSKKPYIENAKKYIKSARMLIQAKREKIDYSRKALGKFPGDPDFRDIKVPDSDLRHIRQMLILCKRAGIELNLYEDKKAFLFNDKRKAVNFRDYGIKLSGAKERKYKDFTRPRDMWTLYPYLEMWHGRDIDKLGKRAREILSNIKYEWRRDEAVTTLKAALHNERKERDPGKRKQMESLLKVFKANKLDSKSFLEAMDIKWNGEMKIATSSI